MTEQEFDLAYDQGLLDQEYAEYLMENADSSRVICNGDTLLSAMEDSYMFDSFKDSMVEYA